MKTIVYEWAGPLTFLRQRVVRGSAAGSSYSGVDAHRMAGRDSRGRAVSGCGLTFEHEVLTKKPGELKLCARCFPGGVA